MEAVEQSYTPSPHVEFIYAMYDVRSWLNAASTELHEYHQPTLLCVERRIKR